MGMVFETMKVAEGAFHMLQWKNLKAYNSRGKSPTQRQHIAGLKPTSIAFEF